MNSKKPNIVFIMADDMGYGDPECYNKNSYIPTPNINRLAKEGLKFNQAHSGCALCTPTRYGLMTGRFQWRTQKGYSLIMPYDPPLIPEERMTIASMLKENNYNTACIGKWHLGLNYRERQKEGYRRHYTLTEEDVDFAKPVEGGPLDLGFDTFFGTAGCSTSDAPYCYFKDKQSVGIPSIQTPEEMNKEAGVYPGLMVPDWDQEAVDKTFLQEALSYIEEQSSSQSDNPFFLYYSLSAPHIPWLNPKFIRGASKEGPRGDMNALVDWCVGQIYQKLEDENLLENTLLIFTSDNGPQKGENGHDATAGLRGLKNSPYEGGHRVPFIAKWPKIIREDATTEQMISLTDLMTTFAELCEYKLPNTIAEDSISFLNTLKEDVENNTRPIIAHTGGHVCEKGHFSFQFEQWKLVELQPTDEDSTISFNQNDNQTIAKGKYELYHMQNDPFEKEDLANDHPEQLNKLIKQLNALRDGPGLRFSTSTS